jgi:hypothetical protein
MVPQTVNNSTVILAAQDRLPKKKPSGKNNHRIHAGEK